MEGVKGGDSKLEKTYVRLGRAMVGLAVPFGGGIFDY